MSAPDAAQSAENVRVPREFLVDLMRLINECDWTHVCSEMSDALDQIALWLDGEPHGR